MARILLVEDDDMIARMLSLRLQLHGHVVEVAHNGKVGLERALTGGHELILMDMHMPVMDGHEAVRQLRGAGYQGLVIAVTASAMSRDCHRAMEAGCDHVIIKPVGEDFEQQVEGFLKT